MHPYFKNIDKFHFNHDICWVTGLNDTYHAGIIDSCHIVDKSLLSEKSPEIYDQNNQIKLTSILHKLFDARLIYFDESGVLQTHLSPHEREQLGIKPGACLVPECMNAKRREYLGRRINDANEFIIAKNTRKNVHKASSVHKEFQALANRHGWLQKTKK